MNNLTYNTQKRPLKLSEYGRYVQDMVNEIKELKSKEERSTKAKAVVQVMSQLNTDLRGSDRSEVLWMHLFHLADYELDIDSPYPIPSPPDERKEKIQELKYKHDDISYRYYGRNIELTIEQLKDEAEGEERQETLNGLASYMKMAYRVFNDSRAPDEKVLADIKEMSGGQLSLDEIQMHKVHIDTERQQRNTRSRQGNNNRKNSRYKGRRR